MTTKFIPNLETATTKFIPNLETITTKFIPNLETATTKFIPNLVIMAACLGYKRCVSFHYTKHGTDTHRDM